MRARLLWTLLLLAAVFSMHGLSCAAADPAMTDASTHMSTTVAHSPSPAAGSVVGPVVVADSAMLATDAGHGTDQPSGHSSLAHTLMVCLAVLAGGVGAVLAALAAWLSRRRLGTIYTGQQDTCVSSSTAL